MIYMPIPDKRCSKCKQWFLETLDNFNRHHAERLRGYCKQCHRAETRKYFKEHPEKKREGDTLYQKRHPEKCQERCRRYRNKHPERFRAIIRRYQQNNKEATGEAGRKWRRSHPEAVKAIKHRRHATKINAEGSFTAEDVTKQYQAQKGKCYWCGKKVGQTYHIDHVIPLSRGGNNWPSNIVVACPFCNESKKDKMPHEWGKGLL